MGNLKNWGKWLLALGITLLISQVMAVRVSADTMTDLKGSSMYVQTYGNSLGPSAGDKGLSAYPTLVSITGNNVVNGRVTTNTTQITIKYSGSTTFNSSSDRFKSFYVDVFKKNPQGGSGVSLATTTTNLTNYGNNANTISFGSGVTQTVNVDLSDLADELPVYIGFRLVSATNYLNVMPILRLIHINQNDVVTDCVVPINLMKNSLAIRTIITVKEQNFIRMLSQCHDWSLLFYVVDILMTGKPANG